MVKAYFMAVAAAVRTNWKMKLVVNVRRCTVVHSYSDAKAHEISRTVLSCNFAVCQSVLVTHVFRGQTCTKNSKDKFCQLEV